MCDFYEKYVQYESKKLHRNTAVNFYIEIVTGARRTPVDLNKDLIKFLTNDY